MSTIEIALESCTRKHRWWVQISKSSTKSKADYTHKRWYFRFNPQSDIRNAFVRSFKWERLFSCRSNFYCNIPQHKERICSFCSNSWLMCEKHFSFPKKLLESLKNASIFLIFVPFFPLVEIFFCVKKSNNCFVFLLRLHIVTTLCLVGIIEEKSLSSTLMICFPRNFEKKMEDE